jgi:hypothetical protein
VLTHDQTEALMSNHSDPATGKQLAYLRSLAERTGTTFVTPSDRRHASREIERLRLLQRDSGTHVETTPEAAPEAVYATAPHTGETEGFGASAKWRRSRRETTARNDRPSPDEAPSAADDATRRSPRRLARYMHGDGERRELIGGDPVHMLEWLAKLVVSIL